jgi:uncharacterized membrane-anchored protein
MPFAEHPLRRWAVDELHSRRFAPVPAEAHVWQIVNVVEPADRAGETEWMARGAAFFSHWHVASRHGAGHNDDGVHFLWERHTEASTITLIVPGMADAARLADWLGWFEQWPGAAVRATRVFVMPTEKAAVDRIHAHNFMAVDTICCDIGDTLRIWSDFGIHADGYGRLVMTAGDVSGAERGRIVQRLQELGNYRNMALLGYPMVQQQAPALDALETRLSDHARRVAMADQDDDILLNELAQMSSELEVIRSETGFRLSATAAYTEIAADRLAALDVQAVPNFQSLTDFTERRLVPAARTCAAFTRRLDQLGERIARVMHTLDVRIDSRIKSQNLQLMQSMERSTALQFRLQTLVEGLSVIAAAYYLVGLIAFVVKGAEAFPKGWNGTVVLGVVTVPIVLIIYGLVRRLRHKMLKDGG